MPIYRPILAIMLISVFTTQLALSAPDCSPKVPEVTISQGKVCGIEQTRDDKSVYAYLGIPFAKPPVGELRWRNPQDPEKWQGVYQATETKSICLQPDGNSYIGKEDCLYLNIWRPTQMANKPLPVMLFIPGGGFLLGAGSLPIYDGAYLANSGNVVVVTINYRLGPWGFLRFNNTKSSINGNFGILDQMKAMQWVNKNIGQFGGDPNKVTIFGESAGAMSAGLHLFSIPDSAKLFRAAIMESNVFSVPYATPQLANKNGAKFVSILCQLDGKNAKNCPKSAEWLRQLPVKIIMQGENKMLPNGGMAGLLIYSGPHSQDSNPLILR